jgi:SAM-dependent methyltransferase
MSSALVEEHPIQERSATGPTAEEETPRPVERVRRLVRRESPRRVKVNTALRIYHEVVGLEHLHYGLWNGEPLTLDGLKIAQDRFSRTLCSFIPSDEVRSILDVGCGIGTTALMLKEAGYEIEGLSPDPYHQSVFSRRVGTPFHLSRFQEFDPPRAYDLVLMSESAQYIWLDSLFPSVLQAARGGRLLVADYFTVNGCRGILGKSGHPLQTFLETAEKAGLELECRKDITAEVAPTLDLARSWLERYVDPCLSIGSDYARRKVPRLAKAIRWMFRRRLERWNEMRRLVDSGEFRREKQYLILRFRVPS